MKPSLEEPLPLGPAARAAVVLAGLALAGAGLVAGFYAVAIVAGALAEQPVQPWPVYALGAAILAFPLLLIAAGFLGLRTRDRRRLGLMAGLGAAALADLLLAPLLLRVPTSSCVANPPHAGRAIEATGCIDRSWSPPS